MLKAQMFRLRVEFYNKPVYQYTMKLLYKVFAIHSSSIAELNKNSIPWLLVLSSQYTILFCLWVEKIL